MYRFQFLAICIKGQLTSSVSKLWTKILHTCAKRLPNAVETKVRKGLPNIVLNIIIHEKYTTHYVQQSS